VEACPASRAGGEGAERGFYLPSVQWRSFIDGSERSEQRQTEGRGTEESGLGRGKKRSGEEGEHTRRRFGLAHEALRSRPGPARRPRPRRPGPWTWSPNGAAEAEPERARRFMRRVQLPLAVVVVVGWEGLPGGARIPSPGAATEAAVTGRTGAWLFWLRACPRRGDSRASPLPDDRPLCCHAAAGCSK